MPAKALTSQGGMKCFAGGGWGTEDDIVDDAEAVDGVGELVLNFLNAGLSSSWGGVSRSGCSPQAPSIKLKKCLASQPIMENSSIT